MLKTRWKEWRTLSSDHNILFCFPGFPCISPHIWGFIPCESMTFAPVFPSGLDVLDDVADGFAQVLVILHVPLHGLEGVDDGGVVTARELPADLFHTHAGDFAQDIDGHTAGGCDIGVPLGAPDVGNILNLLTVQ